MNYFLGENCFPRKYESALPSLADYTSGRFNPEPSLPAYSLDIPNYSDTDASKAPRQPEVQGPQPPEHRRASKSPLPPPTPPQASDSSFLQTISTLDASTGSVESEVKNHNTQGEQPRSPEHRVPKSPPPPLAPPQASNSSFFQTITTLNASTGSSESEVKDYNTQGAQPRSPEHRGMPKSPPSPLAPPQASNFSFSQTASMGVSSVNEKSKPSFEELDTHKFKGELEGSSAPSSKLPQPPSGLQLEVNCSSKLQSKKRKIIESSNDSDSESDPPSPPRPPSPHTLIVDREIARKNTQARMQPANPLVLRHYREGFTKEESQALRREKWKTIENLASVAHRRKIPKRDASASEKPFPDYLFTTPPPVFRNLETSFTEGNLSGDGPANTLPIAAYFNSMPELDTAGEDDRGAGFTVQENPPANRTEGQLETSSAPRRKRNPPRSAQSVYQYSQSEEQLETRTSSCKPEHSALKKLKIEHFQTKDQPDSEGHPSPNAFAFVNETILSIPGPEHPSALSPQNGPKPPSAFLQVFTGL